MEFCAFKSIIYTVLLCSLMSISNPVNSQESITYCDILANNQSESVLFRYDNANSTYSEFARLSSNSHWISPTGNYIAGPQEDNAESTVSILIYDIMSDLPSLYRTIQGFRIVRGDPWSSTDEFLLLEDAQNNRLLHIYHLKTQELELVPQKADPLLVTYQAHWGYNDEYILFVAEEKPFPRTEYADVVALYMRYSDDSYEAVSSPQENVQSYFQNVVSVDRGIIYSSCDSENEDCQITFVDSEDQTRSVIEGKYYLRGQLSDNELLLTSSGQLIDNETNTFQILSLDLDSLVLTEILQISSDADYPIPLLSWSANGHYISYVDSMGSTVIYDLSEDTSTVIDAQIEFDAGRWNPTGNQLLLSGSDSIYLFDADDESLSPIIEFGEDDILQSPSWICLNE